MEPKLLRFWSCVLSVMMFKNVLIRQ